MAPSSPFNISNLEWLNQISNQYYGCDGGPCEELNRLISTPQEYSAFTQQYLDCLPDPTPFPCSAITHCISELNGYTEYTALLTQSGTAAPTESILRDNLLGGTWSYVSVGHYYYTNTGAFTNINKVEVRIETSQVLAFTMTNRPFNIMSAARLNNDVILVKTGYIYSVSNSLEIFGTVIDDIFTNDILSYTPITIRVWS